MAINTKSRQELKSYFVNNAIPTEGNFTELIDAPLNQADDGVFKLAGEPLSVVAAANEQKQILRFYADYPAANPDWMISLDPAQDPGNPASNRAGFGIADGAGNTRLFIHADGRLGVGTNEPLDKLHVEGGDVQISGGRYRRLKIVSDQYWAGIELVAREQGEAGHPYIDFVHGDLNAPNYGVRVVSTANDELRIEAATGPATLRIMGDVTYDGALAKLDVRNVFNAIVRAADFQFGHSSRRGSPGRAMVDHSTSLIFNYGGDWPLALVDSPLAVRGNLGVGLGNNASAFPLDVRVAGVSGWDRLVVTTTNFWDGNNQRVTIGAGGALGLMLHNPHVSWHPTEPRASIRYGRTNGETGNTYWDVGLRSDGAFSFDATDGGGIGEVLRLGRNGESDFQGSVTLGLARSANNFNVPLRSGFYQYDNPAGRVPDSANSWVHMITVRHANPDSDNQLQIAASYAENDKLYFRKIARPLTDASRPAWNEVATVTNGILRIGDWSIEAVGDHLFIRRGSQTVARFSVASDRFNVFRDLNGIGPYMFYNINGVLSTYGGTTTPP